MWCEVVVDTGDMKIAIILGYEGLNVSTGRRPYITPHWDESEFPG